MQAGNVQRHIDLQADGQAYTLTLRQGFNTLNMLNAINHQSDTRALTCCLRNRGDILLIPDGIADQEVSKAFSSQVESLACGVAHDTLKTAIGSKDALQNGNAAQRFGSKTDAFALC